MNPRKLPRISLFLNLVALAMFASAIVYPILYSMAIPMMILGVTILILDFFLVIQERDKTFLDLLDATLDKDN